MLKMEEMRDDDIDCFIDKVDAVNAAIKDMKDGKIDPKNIRVKGIPTDEERKQMEIQRIEAEEKLAREINEKEKKRKIQEKELWWKNAELIRCIDHDNDSNEVKDGRITTEQCNNSNKNMLRDIYSTEYSRWDRWEPDDPVTRDENEAKKESEERIKNEVFEKANPDFCNQFINDMEKRKERDLARSNRARAIRLKGNRWFKAKQMDKAIEYYMDSLKQEPFIAETLINIAMVHIKVQNWSQAEEFCNRCLYLYPTNVKALFRRATAIQKLGRLDEAKKDWKKAMEINPENKDIQNKFQELVKHMADNTIECVVMKDLETDNTLRHMYSVLDKLIESCCAEKGMQESGDGGNDGIQIGKQLEIMLSESPHLRAYLRISDSLVKLIHADQFQALVAALKGEHKSQRIMWQNGWLTQVQEALDDSSRSMIQRCDAAMVIKICLTPEGLPSNETRETLNHGNVYMSLLSFLSESDVPSVGVECTAEGIKEAAVICQTTTSHVMNPVFSTAIPVLSQCLVRRLKYIPSSCDSAYDDDILLSSDACVNVLQALVCLASKKDLRSLFQQIIQSPRDEECSSTTPVMRLMSIIRSPKCIAKEKQWALAACMNASLDEPSVVACIHKSGGTVLALAILSSEKGEEDARCIGHEVRKHAAGLLSRIVCHETVLSVLSQPSYFRILAQVLARSTLKLESIGEKSADRDIEEHVVRVLARVLREKPQNISQLLNAALEENLIVSLISLLPTPRCDELTRQISWDTVSLPPSKTIGIHLAANICSALIPLLEVTNGPLASQFVSCDGIEKIVSLYANAPGRNASVRKNVAICMAKLTRNEAYKIRITDLRGMEMLSSSLHELD